MRHRKSIYTFVLLFAIVGLLSGTVSARTKALQVSDGVVMTAVVVAIDRVDRILTLRKPNGELVTIGVGTVARNFDQIAIGDELKVEYYEALTVSLGKAGEQPDTHAQKVVARSAKGEKPADGRQVTTRVDPSVSAFDTLQPGDSVHASYAEAFAISVGKP